MLKWKQRISHLFFLNVQEVKVSKIIGLEKFERNLYFLVKKKTHMKYALK